MQREGKTKTREIRGWSQPAVTAQLEEDDQALRQHRHCERGGPSSPEVRRPEFCGVSPAVRTCGIHRAGSCRAGDVGRPRGSSAARNVTVTLVSRASHLSLGNRVHWLVDRCIHQLLIEPLKVQALGQAQGAERGWPRPGQAAVPTGEAG